MEDERFRQELDELFKLFKKLMERHTMDDIPGVNKLMLQQFQMFFSNYETMKGDIARQLQSQFGDSVKEMVHQLVLQLREELGEDDMLIQDTSVDVNIVKKPEISKGLTIEELDEMLKNPDLTEEEIDDLLEKRHKLSNG
jgi:hypothetical protein